MTAQADLIAAWATAIADIDNDILAAKATLLLEQYTVALTAATASSTRGDLMSYSIGDRSFSFSSGGGSSSAGGSSPAQATADDIEAQLVKLVYGTGRQRSICLNPDYVNDNRV